MAALLDIFISIVEGKPVHHRVSSGSTFAKTPWKLIFKIMFSSHLPRARGSKLLLLLSCFSRVRLSPGKNTAVGCHSLLQCMKVKSEREVTQWCSTLSDPMDCSPPGSSIHGIFQARVLEWGAKIYTTDTVICICVYTHVYIYSVLFDGCQISISHIELCQL